MSRTDKNPVVSEKSTLVERLDALYEYDREPVAKNKLHGWKTYIAMFSGEHVAGTEFVLGPLMVMHGVSAFDFFVVGPPLDGHRGVGGGGIGSRGNLRNGGSGRGEDGRITRRFGHASLLRGSASAPAVIPHPGASRRAHQERPGPQRRSGTCELTEG